VKQIIERAKITPTSAKRGMVPVKAAKASAKVWQQYTRRQQNLKGKRGGTRKQRTHNFNRKRTTSKRLKHKTKKNQNKKNKRSHRGQ
jgi:pyruvate/2-oxoglutarate dehydrogenase complex dihydrolipoamide dehydrogenase (E3) component